MDWLNNDTSPEAEAVLIDGFRRMSTIHKADSIRSMTQMVQRLALARIRAQYGDRPEREMRLRLAALWLPRETMIAAFGWDPEVEGY